MKTDVNIDKCIRKDTEQVENRGSMTAQATGLDAIPCRHVILVLSVSRKPLRVKRSAQRRHLGRII